MTTKPDTDDEQRDADGDPHVPGTSRMPQREMATPRMMLEAPKADVDITNPTHLVAALECSR